MPSVTQAFNEALSQQAAAALVGVVSSQPNITVADLRSLVEANPVLGSLTLAELVSNVGRGSAKRQTKAGRKPGRKPGRAKQAGGSGKGRDLHKQGDRDQLDKDVLAAMNDAGDWIAANDLREVVGRVDAGPLRNTLNRLIEDGRVVYKGKARWTVYRLA